MECAQCGAVIPDGFKYCANCSAALARQTVTGVGDDTHRWLAEANLLRIRKQYEEAISLCTRVLRIDPANATAHSLMGDIHRDEADPREALGWYKLAVQLNPQNPADRKKLEEMIDRVYPGGKQPSEQADSAESSESAAPAASVLARMKFAWRPAAIRELLYKITPTQVIIASTVLAVVVMVTILLVFSVKSPRQKPAEPQVTVTNEPVPSPVPDPSPQPDTGRTLIISPANPDTPNPKMNTTTPAPTPPPPKDPSTPGDTRDTPSIPPFNPPVKPRMSAEKLNQETEKIQAALKDQLSKLKLQTELRGVSLNPATNVLTIEYEVPLLRGAAETKEGLLYAGFELVWVADNNSAGNIVRYSLYGYGHLAPGQPAKLALYGDVSPQQANDARNLADYAAVAKEMSNVWWHDDIAGAVL